MDVGFFLKSRTTFLRQFYRNSCAEFLERKRRIDTEEYPFDPPYSEDCEPAFLQEWLEADDSLHIIGYTCITMLAAALHLYIKTWESELGPSAKKNKYKTYFKVSWLNGYKRYFAEEFHVIWENSQVNLSLLEEIVLARNSIQHPQEISIQRASYSKSDVSKLRHPFFIDKSEVRWSKGLDEIERAWFSPPTVHITSDKLYAAIDEVETFCAWLDNEIAPFLGFKPVT